MLWSINARLGALLPDGIEAGGDLEPLGTAWLAELGEFASANAEDTEEAIEEAKRERSRDGG